MTIKRASKVMGLEEAVSVFIKKGTGIGIGGIMEEYRPCAFFREIIRQNIGDLTLYAGPVSSYDVDLLIGSGLVAETVLPMVTMGELGIAPNFRKAAQNGQIKAHLLDIVTFMAGLLAGAQRAPYHIIQSLKGTDMLAVSPLYETLTDSKGNKITAVKAMIPDVTVLHAEQADKYGNIRSFKHLGIDRIIAKAARKVVVTVEEIIPHEEILKAPAKTMLGAHWIDAVVEVPYGAHPCGCSYYEADITHIKEYLAAAKADLNKEQKGWNEYYEKYIYNSKQIIDYLEQIGGVKRLLELGKARQQG